MQIYESLSLIPQDKKKASYEAFFLSYFVAAGQFCCWTGQFAAGQFCCRTGHFAGHFTAGQFFGQFCAATGQLHA